MIIYKAEYILDDEIISFYFRHLKQLGLVGEDSGMLKLTFGFALLALGSIFAFRYFANR